MQKSAKNKDARAIRGKGEKMTGEGIGGTHALEKRCPESAQRTCDSDCCEFIAVPVRVCLRVSVSTTRQLFSSPMKNSNILSPCRCAFSHPFCVVACRVFMCPWLRAGSRVRRRARMRSWKGTFMSLRHRKWHVWIVVNLSLSPCVCVTMPPVSYTHLTLPTTPYE